MMLPESTKTQIYENNFLPYHDQRNQNQREFYFL